MINLLPPRLAGLLLADYRRRRRVIAAQFIFVFLLTALALIFSSYFSLRHRNQGLTDSYEFYSNQDEVVEYRELLAQLRDTSSRLALLRQVAGRAIPLTPFVEKLLNHRPVGVTLTGLIYDQTPTGEGGFQLIGEAATRSNLLEFLTQIKADPAFLRVDSPAANLIRERNLTFRFNLKIAINTVDRLVLP